MLLHRVLDQQSLHGGLEVRLHRYRLLKVLKESVLELHLDGSLRLLQRGHVALRPSVDQEVMVVVQILNFENAEDAEYAEYAFILNAQIQLKF